MGLKKLPINFGAIGQSVSEEESVIHNSGPPFTS